MLQVNPAEVRSALRAVLRAVDRHLTHINGNRQWRQEVIARFRATPQEPTADAPTNASPSAAAAAPFTVHSAAAASGGTPASSLPISPAGHPPTAAQALALAREWAELANNIARHKELLLSYNIGLDVDERTKRMVEATARRVGFALPDSPASGKK